MARRDYGSGSLFYREDKGLWVGTIDLPERDGKRRRKTVSSKTKSGAQAKMKEAQRTVIASGDIETTVPTLAKWLEQWLELRRKDLKPSVWPSYESKCRNYIIPLLGKKKLDALQPRHIRQLEKYIVDELGKSSTTALAAHAILSKALTDAQRERLITENVAQLVGRPKKEVSTRRALTVQEAKRVLWSVASDTELALQWSIALLLGVRQGERLGITREAVDLSAGVLRVIWQLQRVPYEHGCNGACGKARAVSCPDRHVSIPKHVEKRHMGGNLYLLRPKSRAGWREIPLPDALREMFARYFAANDFAPTDLIFTRDGGAWDSKADNQRWLDTLEAAGVPRVTLHEARHTTATLLHELGVPDQTRIAILGHTEIATTATYTHITDDVARASLSQLSSLLTLTPEDEEAFAAPQIGS